MVRHVSVYGYIVIKYTHIHMYGGFVLICMNLLYSGLGSAMNLRTCVHCVHLGM